MKTIIQRAYKGFLYTRASTLIASSYLGYPYYLTLVLEITERPFYNTLDMVGSYGIGAIVMSVPIITNWIGMGLLQEAMRA
jgi:hypothetical protein